MGSPALATSSGVRTSRPTIVLDGVEETALAQGLNKLVVSESVHGLFHAEATFANWGKKGNSIDFLYFDRVKLDFGKSMQVKLDTDRIFDGSISAIEAEFCEGDSPRITVLMEDRLGEMRVTRRTRSFNNMSDGDVMRQIASDNGLQASVDVAGPVYEFLAQVNTSDLAFLRERARAVDAEVWVDGSQLFVKGRTSRNGGTVQLNYGNQLSEVRVTADLAGQRTSVSVSGWDIGVKDTLQFEAGEDVIANEVRDDTSGIDILKSKSLVRKEALVHAVPLTTSEAQTEAEAWMRMTARRFVTARGLAQGNAQLRVGKYADLQGIGALFSGKYYVTEVSHHFDDAAGYLTRFTAERPGIGRVQ